MSNITLKLQIIEIVLSGNFLNRKKEYCSRTEFLSEFHGKIK